MNNHEQVPVIFNRHIGTWKGKYIKTDSNGYFVSSFLGQFTILIDGINYSQVNEYEYPDGKTLRLEFQGKFKDGILELASSSYSDFTAIAWDAGQDTIGFRATKTEAESIISFMETITLIKPNYRVRSTQSFKNGIFNGINFIEETLITKIN